MNVPSFEAHGVSSKELNYRRNTYLFVCLFVWFLFLCFCCFFCGKINYMRVGLLQMICV